MHISDIAVDAQDLVLGYGSTIAVDRSSFTIPSGGVTAVIGPNGSGKSTVLNAIAGLAEPIDGNLQVSAREAGAHRISYVLQTTKVNDALPISVREVVAMARFAGNGGYHRLKHEDRAAVTRAMGRTGILQLGSKHLRNLSGGERQRVFIAQGLAQDHDMLLLDEPMTGIDLATAQAIDAVIHDEVEEGCTVIMSTHDLSEARVADHVLLLSGRAIASGPPEEVLTTEHLTAAYGSSLLHVDDGRVFIDDHAHRPVPGRHVHRERTIHTETSPTDLHPESS